MNRKSLFILSFSLYPLTESFYLLIMV